MVKKHNLEVSKARALSFIAVMKSIVGFEINHVRLLQIHEDIGKLILTGATEEAAAMCGQFVALGRSVVGNFLYNSVVNQIDEAGEITKEARFHQIVRELEEDGYGKDLVDRMKKYARELLEAVRIETSWDFTRRVAAYNKMYEVIAEAKEEQGKRDFKRQMEMLHGTKAVRRAQKAAEAARNGEADNSAEAEASRAAGQRQRDAMIRVRVEEAKSWGEALSL